jgi:hypothetical protein
LISEVDTIPVLRVLKNRTSSLVFTAKYGTAVKNYSTMYCSSNFLIYWNMGIYLLFVKQSID